MVEKSKKVQESRLKWYGHVLRREEEYVGKIVVTMEVPGKSRRGRPKRRWLDNIKTDLGERELSGEEAQHRVQWRRLIRHIDPTQKWERMRKKKKCILIILKMDFIIIIYVALFPLSPVGPT